jgi:polyhydroxybutyrate depolymerase
MPTAPTSTPAAVLTATPVLPNTPASMATATAPATVTPDVTPPAPTLPGDYVEAIESGGQTRHYRLHVPPGYRPDEPVPLVINLHGLGSSMDQQALLSGASEKADEAGFVVVYPQGSDVPRMWHGEPSPAGREDVQFIRELVAHLQERLNIDPDRIYATGFSNGGGMAHRLACDLSDTIAAIGPVAGAYLLDERCTPERPVPVIAFHGTADPIVPYAGQGRGLPPVRTWAARWAARNGCDGEPAIILEQGSVTAEAWGGCDEGADVVLYTIRGGGHTWPRDGAIGPGIHGMDLVWAFFEAHPKR